MVESQQELAYYRTVEDLFAQLRGRPHVLSPRDFQLLRTWWREGVPLSAVEAGVTEVFSRRRQSGEDDPVVSLSYCRHAVRRAAKRLELSRVGAPERAGADDGPHQILDNLSRDLERAAKAQAPSRPAVASCLRSIRDRLIRLRETEDTELIESSLFTLETSLLEGCWNALDRPAQERILARARRAAGEVEGPAGRRALRAHRDRELRILLDLPRLELP